MKLRLAFFFLVLSTTNALVSQTSLSGIINNYTAVTGIEYCAAKLVVADPSSFQEGQAVLLIQMQGATINESNSSNFGNITSIGQAGKYERGRIQLISGNEVFLEYELINTYDLNGKVQLVTIPEYEDAIVSAQVSAQAWDGAKGGIVALDVANTLSLQGPIRADGSGFRGGVVQVINSNCQWFLNEDDYYYAESNWRGARKGEGVAALIQGKEKGRGPQANGGGGGNDHNAGGGGGAQLSTGGIGGLNVPSSSFGCDGDFPGMGGKSLPAGSDRLFLGGGGGAGHADDAGTGTSGGQGGGIVLIWAGSIDGQNQEISANGQNVPLSNGDGAGGGGGGGSIVLFYQSAMSPFLVSAKGGKGGDTNNLPDRCYAPGGGGSGGRLLRNGPTPPTLLLAGGAPGVNTTASSFCSTPNNGATAGNAGQEIQIASFPEGNAPIVIPSIDQDLPAQLVACPGQPISLALGVSGNDLSFQWQVNDGSGFADISDGPLYSGAQTPELQLSDPQTAWNGYQYQCIVSSPCFEPLTSQTTLLQIETPPIPDFSYVVNGTTVTFQNESINADSVEWNFGDGNQSGLSNPIHTYAAEGSYTVIITAFNACGSVSASQEIVVGFPPSAAFDADFTGGCAPLTVQFEDQSSGNDISSWSWSFPGGEPAFSSQPDPVVTYTMPGVYDVTLIVANGVGADTLVVQGLIEVVSYPEADFTYSSSGDTAFFVNQSIGSNLNYSWNFGDGSPVSNATNPVHVFPGPGVYEVTLTALNTYCAGATSLLIQVGPNATAEEEAGKWLNIYPNPFGEVIFVEVETAQTPELRIWNAQGILLEKGILNPGVHQIGVSDWPAGLYWVEWRVGQKYFGQRMVKVRP